tara:strand:+ start:244 stop:546 length:303 start_codon:yes stop_codon:yes gene_type:complete
MIGSNKSRFKTYNAVKRTFRGKPFVDLNSSKQWKSFITNSLENVTYKLATIPNNMEYRPDIIANAAYGTSDLWWLICAANNITDPNLELVAGKQIILPII